MDSFKKEVSELSTNDLLLIVEDQAELYTKEEFKILQEELVSRSDLDEFDNFTNWEIPEELKEKRKKLQREQAERARAAELQRQKKERENQERQRKQNFERQLDSLRSRGYDGYYEYTTLSLVDDQGGGLTPDKVSKLLNSYAIDGWKLVSAYSNELGHNSTSGGFGGFSTGTNSTVDQHILIMERFIKI